MFLITNDDGMSEGFRLLKSAVESMGSARAIIPAKPRSAMSKSMTFHKALRLNEVEPDTYTLNGTPADCVAFALHDRKLFPKKPELVVSGINEGYNISEHTIMTSGTLGACFEASLLGVKAIAFGCHVSRHTTGKFAGREEKIRGYCKSFIEKFLNSSAGINILSINFPENVEHAKIIVSKPKKKLYDIALKKRKDPDGREYYWLAGETLDCENGEDDCCELLTRGNITVTPIKLSVFDEKELEEARKLFSQ